MRKVLSAIVLTLAALTASSTAKAFDCAPKNWGGSGSIEHTDSSDPAGTYIAWACPAKLPDGSAGYSTHYLIALKGVPVDANATLAAVPQSGTVLDTLNAVVAAAQVPPTAGQQAIDYQRLHTFASAYVANVLAAQVVPSAVPVYRTPASGTLTVYSASGGRLTGLVAGVKAAANSLCDCAATKAVSGASTYCAWAGSAPSQVTLCLKVSP